MSQIRVNEVVSENALSAPHFPFGATGINTASDAEYAEVAGIATNAQGLTGTPDITVGNIVAVGATFSGDVSIGGTISYEDVTNVNAIGVITATKGIDIRSNTLTDTTVFRYEYDYIDDEGSPQNDSVSFDRVQTGAINTDNSPNTSLVTAGAVVASTVAAAQGLSGNPDISVGTITFSGDGSQLSNSFSQEDIWLFGGS